MEPDKPLIHATETPLRWMLNFWRLRKSVRNLAQRFADQMQSERDANHLLRIELDDLKSRAKVKEEEHQMARDGNRALLKFIHVRDRLNVKLEPGTIRAMLNK